MPEPTPRDLEPTPDSLAKAREEIRKIAEKHAYSTIGAYEIADRVLPILATYAATVREAALRRAAEMATHAACRGHCFHAACQALKNLAKAILAEIGDTL